MLSYRVAAVLMCAALAEGQTVREPNWTTQTRLDVKGQRIVSGTAHDVPADEDKGHFDISFTCNAESMKFDITYNERVDNSRKSTQTAIDPSSLKGKLTIEFPPGLPFRPKGKDTEERTFQATDLNNATVIFSNISVASETEQLGGDLARRRLPQVLDRTQRIASAFPTSGTLTELYTASSPW